MKKCKFCKQELPDEIDFCPYCMQSQNIKQKVKLKSLIRFQLIQKPVNIRLSKNPILLSLQVVISAIIISFGIIIGAGILVGIIEIILEYTEAMVNLMPFLP